jgi:hypothetical protein
MTEGQLLILRGWLDAMGATVQDVPIDLAVGRDRPSIQINFPDGIGLNAVEDKAGGVLLLLSMAPAPEVAQAARSLNAENQEKLLLVLKNNLLSVHRLSWQLEPVTVTRLGQLQRIVLYERFRVEESDASTYNRFQDAFAELSTVRTMIRVLYESTVGVLPKFPRNDASTFAYR